MNLSPPYRSREDFERQFAHMFADAEILSRVLYTEVCYRVIAEVTAQVLAVVAVEACGALLGATGWANAISAGVVILGALRFRGTRRLLRSAWLTREAAWRKVQDREAAWRWSRELHQGDDEDADVCG